MVLNNGWGLWVLLLCCWGFFEWI